MTVPRIHNAWPPDTSVLEWCPVDGFWTVSFNGRCRCGSVLFGERDEAAATVTGRGGEAPRTSQPTLTGRRCTKTSLLSLVAGDKS